MPHHWRHFWGPAATGRYNFHWDRIRHDSFVVVTAAEGPGFDRQPAPQRFRGNAMFEVASVAPYDGGVAFWVLILDLFRVWPERLNLWTDITVFDPEDDWGQN